MKRVCRLLFLGSLSIALAVIFIAGCSSTATSSLTLVTESWTGSLRVFGAIVPFVPVEVCLRLLRVWLRLCNADLAVALKNRNFNFLQRLDSRIAG